MNIKKHIPNAITCLNLLSGAMALIYVLHEGDHMTAIYFIIMAAVFDFFDGLVARLLGVTSPIGKDLDSLADIVSFGLAPSVLLLHSLWEQDLTFWGATPALLIAAFSALRLAKFNNDSRQTTSFIGLPVPANAFFWIGITLSLPNMFLLMGKTMTVIIIYALVALFCYFLVSEIPMFSFKMSKSTKNHGQDSGTGLRKASLFSQALRPQVLLVIISLIALVLFHLSGLSLVIVAYILLSLLNKPR